MNGEADSFELPIHFFLLYRLSMGVELFLQALIYTIEMQTAH